MGWRVAGVVVALWAFNVAMHQPIFAVCIGLLAGWLFGRGRQHTGPAVPMPQATSQSSAASAPELVLRGLEAPSEGPSAAVLRANSAALTGGPPQQLGSVVNPGGQLPGEAAARRRAPGNPVVSGAQRRERPPTIATRTSSAVLGIELSDPYARKEKRWTREEQLELLDLYGQGKKVMEIAQAVQVDQKQVAIKLVRLLLSPSGDIENADGCLRHGKQYTKDELRVMGDLQGSGMRLRTIANEVQRTQLGVGWRLLDMHVPQIPAILRGGLRSDI